LKSINQPGFLMGPRKCSGSTAPGKKDKNLFCNTVFFSDNLWKKFTNMFNTTRWPMKLPSVMKSQTLGAELDLSRLEILPWKWNGMGLNISNKSVLRIRDVYPGSRIWFLPIPDHGTRIQKSLSSKLNSMGLGSGIRKKPIPDPGVKKAPDPGSGSETLALSPSPPFSVSQQAGRGLIKNIRTICAEQV
jgi:hypothetical protein